MQVVVAENLDSGAGGGSPTQIFTVSVNDALTGCPFLLGICDRRDNQKKRFIEALTAHGTVYHAAQAAGISRQTAYRWRQEDLEFADLWVEAIENAVDAVESTIYKQAVGGNTLAGIFYLKAHRPICRDRLNIDIEQLRGEVEERMEQLRENPGWRPRVITRLPE